MRQPALWLLLCAVGLAPSSRAQDRYGARGLFPVYESAGQWLIFDKPRRGGAADLAPGGRFLVVGSAGAELFIVARSSPTYGGLCRGGRPVRLRAALLKGPRSKVGDPVLAVRVARDFTLRRSRARYQTLTPVEAEPYYRSLGAALGAAAVEEAKAGAFGFKPDDQAAAEFLADPKPEKILHKIDFVARPRVAGLERPAALVTEAQISASFRRCLRLADGDRLIGDCVEMPRALMTETSQLRFVTYDPGGRGAPLLLAYTRGSPEPLWGHERWGFVLRPMGARLFLRDAMDPRCREGF